MFDDIIQTASATWNVPISWIQAVISVESDWNAQAYNANDPTGAYGLMQILYRTAEGLGYAGDPVGLLDPAVNIDLGTRLLGQLRAKYGDDFRSVYSAYNSGSSTLWQTSEQVAANVARALAALVEYSGEAVTWSGMSAILIFLLIWLFRRRK